MFTELGARWKTALALLIAVATALLFSTATPMTPPPQSQGEAFCPPEQHDNPCISKQESSKPAPPRADHASTGPRLADLQVALPVANVWSLPTEHFVARTRAAGGVYARGPPIAA